jgi:RimJ/RimL family protein N-acetyltransferase
MRELQYPDPVPADDIVRLRAWTQADIAPAHRAVQDPLIARFTRVPENETEDELREFVAGLEPARVAGDGLGFVIADAATDEFLGTIALMRFDWQEERCEIGYYLAAWARGRGAATSGTRLLSRWAVTELGMPRVSLHTSTDNLASQRVAERSGFVREGVLRSFEVIAGRREDTVVYSLLPADLQPSSKT